MITFELQMGDLARTRFAISPLWETIGGIRLLGDPGCAIQHLPWIERVQPAIAAAGLDLTLPSALARPSGCIPDFLTPPPTSPLPRFEDELEALTATPLELIAADVAAMRARGQDSIAHELLSCAPERTLSELVEVLAAFWEIAIEPFWPRIHAVLAADLAHRARRLTDGGPEALFADLHDAVRLGAGGLEVRSRSEAEVRADRGVLLMPTALHWGPPAAIVDAPWQPTLMYPARGLGLLWEPGRRPVGEALVKVLGRQRAQLLEQLDAPVSTTELARRLELTPGGVSQQLTSLRDAGLIAGTREGRSVLYVRTPLGEQLLRTDAAA